MTWNYVEKFTWRILYIQALGPPEKDAKTTGHGLIFSAYISFKLEKNSVIFQNYNN